MYWEMVPQISLEKFEDFFTYYKGTPNQKAALELFWKGVPSSLLKNDSAWTHGTAKRRRRGRGPSRSGAQARRSQHAPVAVLPQGA